MCLDPPRSIKRLAEIASSTVCVSNLQTFVFSCMSVCVTTRCIFTAWIRQEHFVLPRQHEQCTCTGQLTCDLYTPILLSFLQSYGIYFIFLQSADQDKLLQIFVNSFHTKSLMRTTVLLNLQNSHNHTSKLWEAFY